MIEFKNLKKSFGPREVLRGISFRIEKGQIAFILGTSGTGKSVLLKNIVGLIRPTSGEIWIDDQEVSNLTEEQYGPIRRKCGMVFQHPALFDSLSIYENVAYGVRRHYPEMLNAELDQRVKECLALVHLPDVEKKIPSELSYGMQKRASMARTLAIGPQILLFDEPTTGLDPVTTNAVNALIADLSRRLETTSIVVSHDMHCALAIADHIVVLDKGQVIEQGPPEDLKKSSVPLVQDFLKEALHEPTPSG